LSQEVTLEYDEHIEAYVLENSRRLFGSCLLESNELESEFGMILFLVSKGEKEEIGTFR
jgi:hypothetical protein